MLDWFWLAPLQPFNERMNRTDPATQTLLEKEMARKVEVVVRELPIEVTVDLGVVELPLSQLASLSPGDLLILNQRVSEPLIARVDGQAKFRGWPGRVGLRQSSQFASLQE